MVFGFDHSSLVCLCVQDYKSLYVAVMNCATLVNMQTDRHRHRHIGPTEFLAAYMISSAN